jgi:TonB family protein
MTGLLQTLIETNLAAAAAIVVVLLIRKPAHRYLGARAAYLLWAIVPAAVLATFIPSRTVEIPAQAIRLPDAMGEAVLAPVKLAAEGGWLAGLPLVLMLVWAAGLAMTIILLCVRQGLFIADMRRGLAGPAVVGFFKPYVITPDDFAARYTGAEQKLILAHEEVHLEHHDARINAVAALTQCLCWFNPLVHVGAHFLRIDQELACDAAVVDRRPKARRAYAQTLLKTQLATRPLPVGCYWPSRRQHPLTERVTMLARAPLSERRRMAAAGVAVALAAGGGFAAWAAQPERALPSAIGMLAGGGVDDGAEVFVAVRPVGPDGHLRADAAPVKRAPDTTVYQAGNSQGVTRPRVPRSFRMPAYPEAALALGQEGDVTIRLCVTADGVVAEERLAASSGSSVLDDAALQVVRETTMEPAMRDGMPISACGYKLTITWTLPKERPAADGA